MDIESIKTANERTLALVVSVQENILDATQTYLANLSGAAGQGSPWTASSGTGELPDAKSLIEEGFAFQSRLLDANKSFTLSLSELWSNASEAPAATPVAG